MDLQCQKGRGYAEIACSICRCSVCLMQTFYQAFCQDYIVQFVAKCIVHHSGGKGLRFCRFLVPFSPRWANVMPLLLKRQLSEHAILDENS